jgi:PhzF family phenazine biosynthesis protein
LTSAVKTPVYQVDAFASRVFAGNPAIVCCLRAWPDDSILAAIAAEHSIPVTAFLVEREGEFEIRYFMPTGELPLVGHASLAAAHVVLRILKPGLSSAILRRRTGDLTVSRLDDDLLAIELPAVPSRVCPAPPGLREALGVRFSEVRASDGQYFVLLEDEAAVSSVAPDMQGLMQLDRDGVIVTARGDQCDFVSRAFAPKEGLPEDPVCGSAHLSLVPYWSDRLGHTEHRALQLSPRGGELHCSLQGGNVRLAGACALYMEGTICI